MTHLESYYEMICKGDVIAGYYLRKQVENLLNDMDNPAYIYDTTEADKRIKFMESYCLQSKDPFYMKPVVLMPWQKAFWESVYSFKMADTGFRRFWEVLLEVARKNGKSTMFAADGNTDLFIGAGGVDICCLSNDDRQAKLIFNETAGMRSRLDPKKRITKDNLTELKNYKRNITVFRLAATVRNLDGFNLSKCYCDESHELPLGAELVDAAWRAMSVKDEPLFLNCTTNGYNRGEYLDDRIEYAKKVIDGETIDPHFMAFLYEQDSELEVWQDEESWEKSNPSLRYGVKKIAKLRADVEAAKTDKKKRVKLLVKDFNIPVGNSEAWLMADEYIYPQEVYNLDEFRGCVALAAVDLSATTDLTNAKILLMRAGDPVKYVYSHYWIPSEKLSRSDDRTAGAEYREWARKGLITIHDEPENDAATVARWLAGLKKSHNIKIYKCGYDQWGSKDFINAMDNFGIECERIEQNEKGMSNAMKLLEGDLKGRRVNYGGNAVDEWCFGNCAVKVSDSGGYMPIKIGGQKARRIDGAVTCIILWETYRRFKSEFTNYIK
ncbi:MAG: terminase large subunit [Clostridia bacterium]|nr:terminase large subunit [Clostridia bacterium]